MEGVWKEGVRCVASCWVCCGGVLGSLVGDEIKNKNVLYDSLGGEDFVWFLCG